MMKVFILINLFASFLLAQSVPVISIDAGNLNSPHGEFVTDRFFSGGGTYKFVPPYSIDVELTTVRHGSNFTYNFPTLPNGKYWVSLNFVEVFDWPEGRRKFHVNINNERVLTDLDISKEAGGWAKLLTKNITVDVRNMEGLSINFREGLRSAVVSSIIIYKLEEGQNDPNTIPQNTTNWCHGALVLRESEKQVKVGPFWSEKNKCHINFELTPPEHLDPLHISVFSSPVTIKIKNDTTLTDDIHVWVKAPVFGTNPIPAKIQVGVLDPSIIEYCTGCEIVTQTRTEGVRLFPPMVVPLGYFLVYNGVVYEKTVDIYSKMSIQLSGAATFRKTAENVFLFSLVNNTQTQAAQIQEMERIRNEMAIDAGRAVRNTQRIEEIRNEMVKSILEAHEIFNYKDATTRLARLEDKLNKYEFFQNPNFEMLKKYQTILNELSNQLSESHDLAKSILLHSSENLFEELGKRNNLVLERVFVPKEPGSCNLNQWSIDNTYKYECVEGVWVRYALDKNWNSKFLAKALD